MPFPQFDGSTPQLWITQAQSYFDMYLVDPAMWVRVATMNFTNSAKRWLQSINHRLESEHTSWAVLCVMIRERFCRDQHELLLRQLFSIKQTGSVQDYVDKFVDLIEQLSAYTPNPDILSYVTRFVDGLCDDIRSVLLVQRPPDLDTACTLALLQEEAMEPHRRKEIKRMDAPLFTKPASFRGAQPLPPPLPRPGAGATPTEDPRPSDVRRAEPRRVTVDDKLQSLRSYRKARGLCMRCGEKWHPGHKCAPAIQLHALQEVWEMCEDIFSADGQPAADVTPPEQSFMLLSAAVHSKPIHPRTLQFVGLIQGRQISILVDSGSTNSFLDTQVASALTGVQHLSIPSSVTVANGGSVSCVAQIPYAEWSIQGYTFHSTLKLIPIGTYDMILGMDWLQAFSPMKVHWVQKWIQIQYGPNSIVLQGVLPEAADCALVQVFHVDDTELVPPLPVEVQQLLDQYQHLFQPPSELPPRRSCDHTIPLIPGAQPVASRSYRYSPLLKTEIETQVNEMLQSGLIRPSSSAFSSPVLLVKKKDGTWRLCVDYRQLNALTIKSKFPIPIVDELLDELSSASWFSSLDLRAGFNQIRLAPGEEHKTAFQTHWGQFEFNVMAFGLTGAPNSFQGAMNTTLKPLLRKCVIVFFDDILVYSSSYEDHIQHLANVFELLSQDQWLVKLSKCRFAQQSISYLGHVISAQGVSTDPTKIEAVLSWPVPQNIKELRSFLGLTGYYRKFVQHYAVIARPLFDLLKKGTLFIWTATHTTTFEALKQALVTAPVLALPNFSRPFQLQTDACDRGVGAVLLQDGHPLAFVSKALGPRTRGLSTYEKEYLAILIAVDQWRSYLQHNEFIIFTDQRSLMHITDQRLQTPWQMKLYTKLVGLQFKVIYKPGSTNLAADALSRHPQPPIQLNAVSYCSPSWLAEVAAGYTTDPVSRALVQELSVDPGSHPPYSLINGILRIHDRIWVGNNKPLQLRICSALHASAMGGHSGFPVTYARAKKLFAWHGMKSDIKQFVASCTVCLQAKPDRARYPGLLSPLPVPAESWQVISMDFIEGLPRSGNANCILVVVDRFSKFAHFIPLLHPFTASQVAQLFLDHIYRLHGMPTHIVSDRDRIFTSMFWKELFRLAQTQLCMSSAYHPQSDGQTERVNQCLETYLRCFVQACPRQWVKWISLAEYWYNTSLHSSLNRSPFEVLYGHPPRHFGISPPEASSSPDVESMLLDRATATALVRQQLLRAQQRMKLQADKRRSERSFQVGDLVYLKLQPYVQASLAPRAHQKLSFRYFGPYKVLSKIGEVAYKLDLPASSSVHPVFHVSLLKPAPSTKYPLSASVPDTANGLQVPEAILQRRLQARRAGSVAQLLIKWSGLGADLATWEDAEAVQQRFPFAPAWGHAGSQAGGGVTPHSPEEASTSKPKRSTRHRPKNVRLAGPEWQCNACTERPM
jgi:hypothetical protein